MDKDRFWGISPALIERARQKRTAYVVVKIITLFSIWAAGAALILQLSWPGKLIVGLLLGFFINGLIQLIHEAWHYNLFNSRKLNAFFGHFLSFIFLVLYAPARHGHVLHHRYNRTEKDPDAYNTGEASLKLNFMYYGVFLIGAPLAIIHFNLLYPLQQYNRQQILRHCLQLAVLVSVLGFIWWLGCQLNWQQHMVQCWLLPILLTSPWNGLKSVADHFCNQWKGDPLHTATTVKSNRFTTYIWNGLNYHIEHHLFPGVPGYNLKQIHQELEPLLAKEKAPVYSGYAKIWWSAFRRGPEVLL
ncbi:fatty acid desaturase family protein [Legionella shakespearei]|uniref:Fatty acid desaturase n=1 Tax=Legionella shakespearei DSM 23087 TaxID=1122169 RepID=A0A0W0YK52_9GAMM|nr:fatty acid desaturase [Legionella shakespearei]KTD57223.1 Fatty acid desaturase [Legionella shakespearei DSM 23087]